MKVRGHICIRRKAKDGSNGQSSFKSIVFIRTNDTPSTPTGGSYTTPVPIGWSDGVPSGTAKLWMSTRIFTSDGLPPQQSVWTTPRQATDTADIDFEFSSVATNPGNPTSNPSDWHNSATENDIWMAVRKKQNGVWGSWEVAKIKGEYGKDGQSTFKSIVFKRQNGTPTTPSGGSYASPVPTGWSDGVPTGTTQLWMSTRIFTSDAKSPQQSAWTTPRTVSDEIDIDFEFSSVATNPGNPTSNPSNWHNSATENDIWMAIRKFKNGSWGSWEISKIKGEDGHDGNPGRDGVDGTNGLDGKPGRTIRPTVWSSGNGKKYCAGDTLEDGVYPLDIVTATPIAIGTIGVSFYMCKRTHTNSANNPIPLSNTTYWEELNTLRPVVTYLILAELIKANYIDVQDLAANNAFIDNLYVKHLSGADGDFSGTVTAQQGEIVGTLKIGEDGELSTDAQLGSTHNRVKLDNDGIKFTSSDSVHGSTSYDTELKKTGLSIGYIRHYSGINIDVEMNIGYGAITRTDNTEQETEYALFANGSYRLAIVSSLPSTTDSSTIYIVTGISKGVYVGSTKIA